MKLHQDSIYTEPRLGMRIERTKSHNVPPACSLMPTNSTHYDGASRSRSKIPPRQLRSWTLDTRRKVRNRKCVGLRWRAGGIKRTKNAMPRWAVKEKFYQPCRFPLNLPSAIMYIRSPQRASMIQRLNGVPLRTRVLGTHLESASIDARATS